MKKVYLLLLIVVLGMAYFERDIISQFLMEKVILKDETKIINNEYYKNSDYILVQNIEVLKPFSRDDFNNIIYTILNSGMEEVTFYCSYDYKNCIEDFKSYIDDEYYIETINNYVNPFNSFKNISLTTSSIGKITINIEKNYSENEIRLINDKIDEFIKNNITNNISDIEKIKLFHNYIINNTKYDSTYEASVDKSNYSNSPYNAYGVLYEGKGICSGYSDVMAIYLDKLGINNYRIASSEHIWNYVYVNNGWYHLDLTWDDPVTNTGKDMLIYDFFLINNNELININTNQHDYNSLYYPEAK